MIKAVVSQQEFMENSIPSAILSQLQAIYERDVNADSIAIVWPEDIPKVVAKSVINGIKVTIISCVSELDMRETLVDHQDLALNQGESLVMLSKYDVVHLAKDILARLWRNEPQRISPWKSLQQLIKVRVIDPRLTRKNGRWLAEALLGCFDRYQTEINFGEVLDQEKAWKALALGYLSYSESVLDLQSLFSWSMSNDVSALLKKLPEDVNDNLGDWLNQGIPGFSELIETLLHDGHGNDLLSIGLVCSVLFHPELEKSDLVDVAGIHGARAIFRDRHLSSNAIHIKVLARFGEESTAAALFFIKDKGFKFVDSTLGKAEQILASIGGLSAVGLSEILPRSYQYRLSSYALSLVEVISKNDIENADAALLSLQKHILASMASQSKQVERALMALRLARWLKREDACVEGAAKLIDDYIYNGSFVDWARSIVWVGDVHDELNKVYHQIIDLACVKREKQNQKFSEQLAAIARGDKLEESKIPVENALEKLVSPIAQKRPVLLLVMDGMNEAVYRGLTEDLINSGWLEVRDSLTAKESCLVAALPTITKISRCSLLSGALTEGLAADEKKAFASHAGLKKVTSIKYPPVVFHKADLQQAGTGSLNSDVRSKIANKDYKVIATVINAIDDQLKSSAQVSVDWSLGSIALLRQVLEAARDAGRVVIVTSDHGHVLDHDSQFLNPTDSTVSNGERYQLSGSQISKNEVFVTGDRVVTPTKGVTLPWSEKVRYTKGKNLGYHGGGSLQEVVIPLGVFISANDELEGWSEVPRTMPSWWYQDLITEVVTESVLSYQTLDQPKVEKKKSAKAKKVEAISEVMEDMFGGPVVDEPKPKNTQSCWIDAMFESAIYQTIKARSGRGIKDEQLHEFLELMEAHQGQVMETMIIRQLSIPKLRIRGFLSGAQKLLNVDGYPILSVDRDSQTVKLNINDIKQQFEL
ncbi:BREX-2 system phosphatase PglZ [Shewanella frigidimarina]|uniref:BREX-2 system phosphatase PglZ n=1 Tax=Shewanella frigidimarina TaxID=56812 RepID=UPI003D794E55